MARRFNPATGAWEEMQTVAETRGRAEPGLYAGDWYDDRDELLAFCRWLIDVYPSFDVSATAILDVIEKPWKWNDEHDTYLTTLGDGNDGI